MVKAKQSNKRIKRVKAKAAPSDSGGLIVFPSVPTTSALNYYANNEAAHNEALAIVRAAAKTGKPKTKRKSR